MPDHHGGAQHRHRTPPTASSCSTSRRDCRCGDSEIVDVAETAQVDDLRQAGSAAACPKAVAASASRCSKSSEASELHQ